MKTRESEEMYLETILLLQRKKGQMRSIDIVEELNYAKSSVSRAVNLLQKRGYIEISPTSGYITLTESGIKRATDIYERHRIITELLIKIGADQSEAEENACRIEHVISPGLIEIIKEYLK